MKIDLHCHTYKTKNHFGSNMTPKNMIKVAKKRNLDGIAITDDDTLEGYFEMKENLKGDKDFLLIPGFETQGFEIAEILVLGIDYIPKKKNLMDFIDEIRDNNGVCILPHPFTFVPTLRYKKSLKELEIFDGIEVINSFDWGIYTEFAEKVADIFNLGKTSGSDAHSLRNIGLAYTICEDPIKDIKRRRTKVVGIESPWTYKISNLIKFLDNSPV